MTRPVTPDILFSSINVAASPLDALRSPEWLGEFARGANCDGVEYMPMFDLLPGHTPRAIAGAIQSGALHVSSYHQSFRESKRSKETSRLPGDPQNPPSLKGKVLDSALGRLIVPEVRESSEVIGHIQKRTGQSRPVVFYPQRTSRQDRRMFVEARTSEPLFQPTDHVARIFGVETLEGFRDHAEEVRGYGYVWDTFHARRRYGREEPGIISDTSVSLKALAPKTTAVHLSLNRTDIPGEGHIKTLQEATDALDGVYTGELGRNLRMLKASGHVGHVVIEATLDGIAEAAGVRKLEDIQKAYGAIAAGFRNFWEHAA
jgi:hypothetical protein